MKIRREFKIGIFAVIVIAVSWWGIKWLGGQNVLLTSDIYYVYYDSVPGLQESSRVTMRGVNVGNVRDITLEADRVLVEIAVESQYSEMIPANSVAEMGSAGLMGGVEIAIVQGDAEQAIESGSVIEGRVKPDMLGALTDKGTELMDGLNETVESVNTLLEGNSMTITSLISNLESMSASIDQFLGASMGDVETAISDLSTFANSLAANAESLESIIADVDSFTGDLADANIVSRLSETVDSLNGVLEAIDSGEGSAGKLIYDAELYNSLTVAGENLGALLEDLEANPMRYVHFSLFGNSEERAAKRAARQAEKAERRAAEANE